MLSVDLIAKTTAGRTEAATAPDVSWNRHVVEFRNRVPARCRGTEGTADATEWTTDRQWDEGMMEERCARLNREMFDEEKKMC